MSTTEAMALLREAAVLQGELKRTLLAVGIAALICVAVWAFQEREISRSCGEPLGWFRAGALGLIAATGAALAIAALF
jgi:hypothetical protein